MRHQRFGRDILTGQTLRVTHDEHVIHSVEPWPSESEPKLESLPWIAPAFWDIQTNGRWGISFSDPGLTVEQAAAIVKAQGRLGAARVCPTLITAGFEAMRHGIATIATACEHDSLVNRMVVGLHLEGPWISRLDGYRGAHPADAVRAPDWSEFQAWQEAAGGRIRIVTLAPETPGAIPIIQRLSSAGIVVALGHTAADGETLRRAVDAGARLSTHLGNGIASPLARHPNPIWVQAAEDRLSASLIADGHHLGPDALRVLARAKGAQRTILVSDASWLAGLPVGCYGPWDVDPSGKVVVSGTPYLAGSNQSLDVGLSNLLAATGWSLADAFATCTVNPARLLGYPTAACLAPGEAANLIFFQVETGRLRLVQTVFEGQEAKPDDESRLAQSAWNC